MTALPAAFSIPFSPPALALPPQTPRVIGRWTVREFLGEGRWTEVYRAAPTESSAAQPGDFVLKVAKRGPTLGRALLMREACVGSAIDHPHVVPVFSWQLDRAPFYLVMPYLPGVTLRQQLTTHGRFPLRLALWILRQVAEGLVALHERRWVHGDLKPENVMLAPTGHATLIDLGFARNVDEEPASDSLMGTPAYAAPERLRDHRRVGVESDVYALGVMAFELLVGERPAELSADTTSAATTRAAAPSPVALQLRRKRPECPPAFADQIAAMVDTSPHRRPQLKRCIDIWLGWELAWLANDLGTKPNA